MPTCRYGEWQYLLGGTGCGQGKDFLRFNSIFFNYVFLVLTVQTLTDGQETVDLQQALASGSTLLEALDVAKGGRCVLVQ